MTILRCFESYSLRYALFRFHNSVYCPNISELTANISIVSPFPDKLIIKDGEPSPTLAEPLM